MSRFTVPLHMIEMKCHLTWWNLFEALMVSALMVSFLADPILLSICIICIRAVHRYRNLLIISVLCDLLVQLPAQLVQVIEVKAGKQLLDKSACDGIQLSM